MYEKSDTVYVSNRTKETFLAFRVKTADTFLGRMIGLLGRRVLAPESGLWMVPCNAIHTIGMLFPIDVVFLDKDFRVVGVKELLRPFSITKPNFRAESVIELPAHTVFQSHTEIGDYLQIRRCDAQPHPSADEPHQEGLAKP
jgi:uncharacterized membrane protein (UPF0127 family)